MFLYLRIIFTILSAVCVAALIPLGALLGWSWAIYSFLGALLFFGLMLLCKQSQTFKEGEREKRKNPKNETAETDDQADGHEK